jgi:hypothetical protein
MRTAGEAVLLILIHAKYTATLQRNFNLCNTRKVIARSLSQFPHSCVCERSIYSHDRSTYFPAAELAESSWEYINHSQKYECRNWDCSRAVPFLECLFWIFGIGSLQCSLYAVVVTRVLECVDNLISILKFKAWWKDVQNHSRESCNYFTNTKYKTRRKIFFIGPFSTCIKIVQYSVMWFCLSSSYQIKSPYQKNQFSRMF